MNVFKIFLWIMLIFSIFGIFANYEILHQSDFFKKTKKSIKFEYVSEKSFTVDHAKNTWMSRMGKSRDLLDKDWSEYEILIRHRAGEDKVFEVDVTGDSEEEVDQFLSILRADFAKAYASEDARVVYMSNVKEGYFWRQTVFGVLLGVAILSILGLILGELVPNKRQEDTGPTYLGDSIQGGQGNKEAAKCYYLAGIRGHAGSQYDLGLMYAYGDGVEKDYVESYAWMNISISSGVAEAVSFMEDLEGLMTKEQIALGQERTKKIAEEMEKNVTTHVV